MITLSRDRMRLLAFLALVAAGCAAASSLAVHFAAPLRLAEHWLQDLRVAGLSPDLPQDEAIVLVTVDENTLATLPYRSPIDRGLLARTIGMLQSKGVRAIGLDILLDRPTTPAADAALRDALRQAHVPVVIATVPPQKASAVLPGEGANPHLTMARAELLVDRLDGIVRRLPPASAATTAPTLAQALARAVAPDLALADGPIAYRSSPAASPPPFRQYPAHTLELIPAKWLDGRVALVGVDLDDIDRHRTPYVALLGNRQGTLPGVAIHAHVLSQLLDGRRIGRIAPPAEWLLVAAFAALGAAIARANLSTAGKSVLLAGALVATFAVAFFVFARWTVLLPVLPNALALSSSTVLAATLLGREDRRQRRRIREAFSRFVPEQHVKRLLADPRLLKLHGERQELSFLFSDVAGFTALCERMPPEEFVPLMNEYLSGACAIATRHGGTIDKIVGDALVVIFGAPIPQEDHPERAVRCAIDLDRFGRDFQQSCRSRGIAFGVTRIGVHTGVATIGNFGGADRISYTAYGDAVNVAARLEAANKAIGTSVCVSAATAARCDDMPFRPIGEARLPGVSRPIAIAAPAAAADGQAPAAAYQSAYAMLGRDEPGALAAFASLHEQFPDDTLVAFHHDRCRSGCSSADIAISKG
jgi:class 3 adenylate cyclase/CHASE2 domain-containing sensor protein